MDLLNEGIRAIDSSIQISGRFFEALKDLYKHDRNKIYDVTKAGLYRFKKDAHDHFVRRAKDRLEAGYIYLYSTKYVYQEMNECLRNHACTSKVLSNDEKNFAPFAAMLMAVLMYWSELRQETGDVYRGVSMTEQDIRMYQVGVQFTWNQFTSTTRNRNRPFSGSVKFIVHNGNNRNSILGPKQIRYYAWDYSLDEVLYCPGTAYKVVKVHPPMNQVTTIELDFIPPDLVSNAGSIYHQNKLVFSFTFFVVCLLTPFRVII